MHPPYDHLADTIRKGVLVVPTTDDGYGKMLTFERAGHKYTQRVAAVVTRDGEVLLHRMEGWSFWVLPGGRAEFLEPSRSGLHREMAEEMGVEVPRGCHRQPARLPGARGRSSQPATASMNEYTALPGVVLVESVTKRTT